MQTEIKNIYKKPLFWAVAGGVLLLGMLIILITLLARPLSNASQTDATGTEPPQTTMEATLPPPEANPLDMGDFALEGEYLTCLTAPSVLGIDVSEWQEEVDWQQVKAAGVEFVMIRAGWRGSVQGVLTEDAYARANYAGATAAGLQVGVYFFSQAISVAEAVEEAEFLLDIISDWELDMPVVYDWEFISAESRTGNVSARTLTECTKTFCERIEQAGFQPMIYFNADQAAERLYLRELTEYPYWLAQYDTVLNYPYKIDMWQYTETGAVPGISGNVDINLYFPWNE